MSFFNAAELLNVAGKLRTSYIHPDELGLSKGLWVRELTGLERATTQKQSGAKVKMFGDGSQEIDMSNMSPKAMAIMACNALIIPSNPDMIEWNDDGYPTNGDNIEYSQMFKPNQVNELNKMSAQLLDVISTRVRKISGLTKESLDEKKDS